MNNIRFSITIPAYKAKYLKEAINSCLSQTYSSFELIIVDDASPEDLWSIVEPFLKDDRVRYYRNNRNCGAINVVDNWNICLSYCTGDYVICMGDDDRLLPCCLDEYSKLICQNPGIGLVHGWTEIIDENSDFLSIQQPRPLHEGAMSILWNRWNGRSKQYIGDWCFNVSLLREAGGFYKLPLAWASDDITAVQIAANNGVANSQTLCFQYRINRYTITTTGNTEIKMNALKEEKEWYTSMLRSIVVDDPVEMKYKILLENELEQHFREKYKIQIESDMCSNPARIIYWIKNRNDYSLSLLRVLYSFFIAIASRFHGI